MGRFPLLLFLISHLVFESVGKTINPFEKNLNEIKRKVVFDEHAVLKEDHDLKRHEVRPIEAGYNHQHSPKNNRPANRKRIRRCFCGISPGASCPNGFQETQIQWNDFPVGPWKIW